jgi:hypothetical protein
MPHPTLYRTSSHTAGIECSERRLPRIEGVDRLRLKTTTITDLLSQNWTLMDRRGDVIAAEFPRSRSSRFPLLVRKQAREFCRRQEWYFRASMRRERMDR